MKEGRNVKTFNAREQEKAFFSQEASSTLSTSETILIFLYIIATTAISRYQQALEGESAHMYGDRSASW